MILTKKEAREFLINYHMLNGSKKLKGKDGVMEYLNRVKVIQYDPLNVVGRNPDLVLQSRIKNYSKNYLSDLLYKDRLLIDGWDKMMSIYSISDWPYFSRVRNSMVNSVANVLEYRDSSHALNYIDEVKEILLKKGPLLATKIDLGSAGKGVWGHKKVSGAVMDYLFNIGDLGVYNKKNTQKVYDLIENLIPEDIFNSPDPFKTDNDFYKWYVKRRIGSIGLLWYKNGGAWLGYGINKKKSRETAISELIEEGKLKEFKVEKSAYKFLIREDSLSLLNDGSTLKNSVRFLAPLDNILWDRDMVEYLFNFRYRWEVYTPVTKREYGYYVLPVLYRDKLVGRFEPLQQRGKDPLTVKSWWWEDGVKVTKTLKDAVDKELKNFEGYLHNH